MATPPDASVAVTVPESNDPAAASGRATRHAPPLVWLIESCEVPAEVTTDATTDLTLDPVTTAVRRPGVPHTGGFGLRVTEVTENDDDPTITGIDTRLPSLPTSTIVPEAATVGSVIRTVIVTDWDWDTVPCVGDACMPGGTPVTEKSTPSGFAPVTVNVAVVWPDANTIDGVLDAISGPAIVVDVVELVVVIGVVVVTNKVVTPAPRISAVVGTAVVEPPATAAPFPDAAAPWRATAVRPFVPERLNPVATTTATSPATTVNTGMIP